MRFTFESIKESLVTRLAAMSNFTENVLYFGAYVRIIEVASYGLELLALYADFWTTQATFKTATLREAAVAHSYFLTYIPHRMIGARGVLKFSADPTFSAVGPITYTGPSVFIPKRSRFTDEDRTLNVYTIEDATYYTGTIICNRTIAPTTPAVDAGNGKVAVSVPTHGMPAGQTVSIRGSRNYDGDYTILPETTANTIVIAAAYVAEVFTGNERIYTGHLYVKCKEGVPKVFTYTAQGDTSEEASLFSAGVDEEGIEANMVDSNDAILAPVYFTTEPYLINQLVDYYAEVVNAPDYQNTLLRFGDGLRTRQLAPGEIVQILYAETQGSAGNISRTNAITVFNDTILDANGNITSLAVTNDAEISDGVDIENIESIKSRSRRLFQAGYRASSKPDWEAIIDNYPGVKASKAWTNYDLNRFALSPDQVIVFLTAVSTDGSRLTPAQQTDIILNYLVDKQDITDVPQFQPLQVLNLRFKIKAIVPNVPFDQVRTAVRAALRNNYSILNVGFGPDFNIYDSNFTNLLDDLDEIIYHVSEVYHLERSDLYPTLSPTTSLYTVLVSVTSAEESDPSKQIYLQSGTVELWIKRKVGGAWLDEKQIARCNSLVPTQLEGVNNYAVAAGQVNYSTNNISFTLTDIVTDTPPAGDPPTTFGVLNPTAADDDGYILKLVYKTRDGNGELVNDVRLSRFFQILDIQDEDVLFDLEYKK